jgi:hypothetical protein
MVMSWTARCDLVSHGYCGESGKPLAKQLANLHEKPKVRSFDNYEFSVVIRELIDHDCLSQADLDTPDVHWMANT